MDGNFSDVQIILKNGQKSDSSAAHPRSTVQIDTFV